MDTEGNKAQTTIPPWIGVAVFAGAAWLILKVFNGGADGTVDTAQASTSETSAVVASPAQARPAQDSTDQATKDALWMEQAKDSVRGELKDANSAEFRNVFIHRKDGAPLVCGEVNAKNGFGGYGGYQKFIYMGSVATVLEEHMKRGEMAKAWNQFCV